VVSISEIIGMEGDIISMQEIFRFRRHGRSDSGGVAGDFETTGVRPRLVEVAAARGVVMPAINFASGRKSV
jgi:pilus assembly protein CpaF